MAPHTIAARIVERAARVGVTVSPVLGVSLAAYVDLLARWNRKINLTALDVEQPSDEAIDRLVVEPLVAARHIRPADDLCIDVGSGGGSPAIPLKLAVTALRLVMVEAKIRKSAFLRETVRQLALTDVEVENRRFEDLLSKSEFLGSASLVSIRAVRLDRKVLTGAVSLLRPAGRIFWFDSVGQRHAGPPPGLRVAEVTPLVAERGSTLRILQQE